MPSPCLPEKTERAALGPSVVGFPGTPTGDPSPGRSPGETTPRICPICGAGLKGRQTSGCSDKHRAALSRQRRAEDKAQRDAQVRGLLERAMRLLASQSGEHD